MRNQKTVWLTLGVVLLVIGVSHWQLLNSFASAIVGKFEYTDGGFFIWNYWWVARSIGTIHNPFFSTMVFYPQEVNLLLHTLVFVPAVLFAPLIWLGVPALVTLNIAYILSFGATAFFTYLLAREEGIDSKGASIAGIASALTPTVFAHASAGHFNLINLWVLPFLFWAGLKFLRRPSPKTSLIFALAISASIYVDFQFLFFSFLVGLVLALGELISRRLKVDKVLRQFIIVIPLLLGLLSPLLIATAKASRAGILNSAREKTLGSIDIKLYWQKSPFQRFSPKRAREIYQRFPGQERESVVSLGVLVLAGALLGVIVSGKKRRFAWLAVGLVALALSLGPQPTIFTHQVKGLYAYLEPLPGFSQGLVPMRWSFVVVIAFSLLLGFFVQKINRTGALIIGLLVILELFPQVPLSNLPITEGYKKIAQSSHKGAVLSLPLDARMHFYQTFYNRPIAKSALGRRLFATYAPYYDNILGLNHLYKIDQPPLPGEDDASEVRSSLREQNIAFIIVENYPYQKFHHQDMIIEYLKGLDLPLFYKDQNTSIYEVI